MDNDCLVVIYKITFSNKNYSTRKFKKIDDVLDLSPNHVFSSNNGHKYYIGMNFKVFVIPTNSRDSKENFKL